MYRTTVLIDAGHGGVKEGVYQTSGKRFEGFHESRDIFLAEGAFNRAIAAGLQAKLHMLCIKTHLITPEAEDITLGGRVRRVNALSRIGPCFLLSIHHNSFTDPRINGAEFFTSRGDTKADPLAEEIAKGFKDHFPGVKLRVDSINTKYAKEADYKILKGTICPAILTEWAFMSNEQDRNRIFDLNTQIDFLTTAVEKLFIKGLLK